MLAVWAKTHKERTARTILDLSSCRPVVANINYVLKEKRKDVWAKERREDRKSNEWNTHISSKQSSLRTHTHTHTEDSSWQLLDGILICPRSPDRPARTCQNIERKRAWERGERQQGRARRESEAPRARAKGQKGGILTNRISFAHIPLVNESGWFSSKAWLCWLFSNMCTVNGLFWFIQSSSCYGLSYWEEEGMVVESQVRRLPSQWPPLILTHRSRPCFNICKYETKEYFWGDIGTVSSCVCVGENR